MERHDIEGAVGVSTLDDLHLALSLDDLLAIPCEAKWFALHLMRVKSPETFATVDLIHQYTPARALALLVVSSVGSGAGELVKDLFQAAPPGQRQAEALVTAYSLFVGCFRLQAVAEWSPNSFAEALEQGDFTDEGFKWFYLLHLGRMALKEGRDIVPARIGSNLHLFSHSHSSDLLDSLNALQSFVRDYPRELLKNIGDKRFKAVLGYLQDIGAVGHLDIDFDSSEDVLNLYH